MNRTVLIAGESNTGKSTSLRNLKDRQSYAYLNADDKALPIGGANAFLCNTRITEDPEDVLSYYAELEQEPSCKGIVLDTLTFLMGLYERERVNTSANTMEGWKNYGIFYKELNTCIKDSNKTQIIMAHTSPEIDDNGGQISRILLKGAAGKIGAEADHTMVVTSKQMPVVKLQAYDTPLLTYSETELATGMKYVFSTIVTKATLGDRTRAPMGFWDLSEQYIDNDVQLILDRMDEFYS